MSLYCSFEYFAKLYIIINLIYNIFIKKLPAHTITDEILRNVGMNTFV